MKRIQVTSPEAQAFEQEHSNQVRALAPECMVLLKNKGVLPLKGVGKLVLRLEQGF